MAQGDEPGTGEQTSGQVFDPAADDPEEWIIERAILNDSPLGQQIQHRYVACIGAFMREDLRPLLRQFAEEGGQPQLLVNGLAELMRSVADSIEFPLDHPRSGFPPQLKD